MKVNNSVSSNGLNATTGRGNQDRSTELLRGNETKVRAEDVKEDDSIGMDQIHNEPEEQNGLITIADAYSGEKITLVLDDPLDKSPPDFNLAKRHRDACRIRRL